MKNKFVTILCCILDVMLLAAIVVGYIGARRERRAQICTGIEVTVLDSTIFKFMNSKDVIRLIDRDFGGYVNRPRDSVKLSKVEKVLAAQGFLDQHEAYFDNDGVLHIEVRQCLPLAKRKDGGQYSYMDRKGKFYAVKEDWYKGLPDVEGKCREDAVWAERFGSLAAQVAGNGYWKENVEKYICLDKGEIILKLAGHNEDFIIGQPVNIPVKLNKILIYIEKVAPRKKQDSNYKSINVNFDKQIVCK